MNNFLTIRNNQRVESGSIPIVDYINFLEFNTGLLQDSKNHCVNYFGFLKNGKLHLINCVANDETEEIYLSSTKLPLSKNEEYQSLTARHTAFHLFEREISENFGIRYSDHPWQKPVRFPASSGNNLKMDEYPFYQIGSEDLHEVGVGPIHAGIIEPGHFRFICKGEQILHLEIQLGYQHKAIERLFLEKKHLLQRTILAESIAGDTTVGHTTAFVNNFETLCDYQPDYEKKFSRTLALELERIAIHTGDLSAICSDISYQLGATVFSRLRTPIINFFQSWCGNRFARGLIRAGANNYQFNKDLKESLLGILKEYEQDFEEIVQKILHHPGSISRLEKTGVVTLEQAIQIGAVGLSAKASGLARDVRVSHPDDFNKKLNHQFIIKRHGDAYSRTQMRREEIRQSLTMISKMLDALPETFNNEHQILNPLPNSFAISLVEGWRGEICHCAITNEHGELELYKVKDPSFHNWMALSLAVRKNEISDFPICNKSFNLSYCGFDL